MELAILILLIALVANVFAWKFVVGVFRQEVSNLEKSWGISQSEQRADELLKAMDSLMMAADRANAVALTLDRKVATAIKLCDLIESKHQWLTDALVQRSTDVVHNVSADVLEQVVNATLHRLERAIPEIILTKVAKYGHEYTIINTLEGIEVDIDVKLEHVPYDRLRTSLVKGLAKLPFQGKPKEETRAQQWAEEIFGSPENFESWWSTLSHNILDHQLKGNIIITPKSGVVRPLKLLRN